MQSNKYQLSTRAQLLHDYAEVDNPDDIAALVASGDCFITLATKLDNTLHDAEGTDKAAVEDVIRTLMYLQRHYAVVKKQPNYRQ